MTELPTGHVYFLIMRRPADPIHDFGLVKIGITWGDVLHRVAKLQTGNPYELLCFDSVDTPWPREVEHFLHRTHAEDMQQTEWLRCSREELEGLVSRAREVARSIEERKSKEFPFLSHRSNGLTRRATQAEFELHAECRRVIKELLPEQLRLKAAEYRLKAATDGTRGIPGVVSVRYLSACSRFSSKAAAALFPDLAARCSTERIGGVFRWRKVPRPTHFATENLVVLQHKLAADEAEANELQAYGRPNVWKPRTREIEDWHREFLQATRAVHRLEADLADRKTELILRLGEHEALDPVCSFKRDVVTRIDRAAFWRNYPKEAMACQLYIPPRLQKNVYSSRSYL